MTSMVAHLSRTMPTLAVLLCTDSFTAAWDDLAADAGFDLLRLADDADGLAAFERALSGEAIGIVAAGGAEDAVAERLALRRLGGEWALVGAAADHRLAVMAMRAGATEYLALPGDLAILRTWLAACAHRLGGRRSGAAFATREGLRYAFAEIAGESPALMAALERVARILPRGNATVLITGETGTGKELVARALHYGGPRAAAPFVDVNCTAIPETLLESELFGHEAGAFTDARTAKPGLFETADGGTLFLDEIGHLPLALQGKLLRVLETRTVRRLGAQRATPFDVRLVAATHVDLAAAVARGEFREDLWYRLNVVQVELPPLRERGDDVLLLARSFLRRLAEEYEMPVPTLTPAAEQALRMRGWAGNVRELRNAMERALLLADGARIDAADVDGPASRASGTGGELPWPAPLHDLIPAAAQAMLARCGGNKSETARRLGISRPRLQRLLEPAADGATVPYEDD
jgi:two-component system response regulator HydG